MAHNLFNSLQDFTIGAKKGKYYSIAALEKAGVAKVSRLPVSIRIVLEGRIGPAGAVERLLARDARSEGLET